MLKNVCSSIKYKFNQLNVHDVDGFLGLQLHSVGCVDVIHWLSFVFKVTLAQ